MLESALGKARHLFAHTTPSVPEMAGAYAPGSILNHPFLDGNARTSFISAAAFVNGFILSASEADAVLQTLALAAGAPDEAGYAAWLRTNSQPA